MRTLKDLPVGNTLLTIDGVWVVNRRGDTVTLLLGPAGASRTMSNQVLVWYRGRDMWVCAC